MADDDLDKEWERFQRIYGASQDALLYSVENPVYANRTKRSLQRMESIQLYNPDAPISLARFDRVTLIPAGDELLATIETENATRAEYLADAVDLSRFGTPIFNDSAIHFKIDNWDDAHRFVDFFDAFTEGKIAQYSPGEAELFSNQFQQACSKYFIARDKPDMFVAHPLATDPLLKHEATQTTDALLTSLGIARSPGGRTPG